MVLNRELAWGLLSEYTQSESLRKHALAVEACMRAYARKLGDDEEKFAITGLLHDFDYEKYPTPQEHPSVGNKIMREKGYPEDVLRAILSHADYSGVKRETAMEKALYACDELSGLITAAANPSRCSMAANRAASGSMAPKPKIATSAWSGSEITSAFPITSSTG